METEKLKFVLRAAILGGSGMCVCLHIDGAAVGEMIFKSGMRVKIGTTDSLTKVGFTILPINIQYLLRKVSP